MGSTLSTLEANIRINLQEATQKFFQSSHIYYYIGEAYRFYFNLMADSAESYFTNQANLGFTANNPVVSLASLTPSLFELTHVERNTSTGTYPLTRDERRKRANVNFGVASGEGYRPTFRLRGGNILLEPTPSATETPNVASGIATSGISVEYIYNPTFPNSASASSFTFDSNFPITFEPMIELWSTIGILESKDGMGGVADIQTFRGRLQKWEQMFIESLESSEDQDFVQYSGLNYSYPYQN